MGKYQTQTSESQSQMTATQALTQLKEGNERFVKQMGFDRDLQQQVKLTSTGQYPYAAIVSCIDSRIPTELVFDQGIGDVFNARIAGNFVNQDILGSLEFACKLAGSKLIVVMGHTSCGAVKGACDGAKLGNLTQMLDKIKPAVDATETRPGEDRSSANLQFVDRVAKQNVRLSIENIKEDSAVLKEMHRNNEIDIVGAIYDTKTDVVEFLD